VRERGKCRRISQAMGVGIMSIQITRLLHPIRSFHSAGYAALIALTTTAGAPAADNPPITAAAVPPAYDWAGFYVGGQIGLTQGTTQVNAVRSRSNNSRDVS